MDYKVKNLYDKIYISFIRGEYSCGAKIPTKTEVMAKFEEITTLDYSPITTFEMMKDIDINYIRKNFSNIIDDIGILFDSIESESIDILDQLTGSLKEHNGSKRELRRIRTTCDDISNGKIGEEYLNYNFTESFDNSKNINVLKSDPINFEAGLFTIRKDSDKILTLNHYAGSKIEFSIIENFAQIIEQGYIGSTDTASILDQDDPRQLIYKITTNRPTRLRTVFALQLLPDGREIEINSVNIDVDSDIAKGFIRLYYKSSYKWNDIPGNSIQEIKNDKVYFNFSPVKTSHIKFEFIKDGPDVYDSNTYYYIINNLAISKATTKKSAILYSNPIKIEKYSDETPIISNISVSGDIEVPLSTEVKLYVAQDILMNGAFLNSYGSLVDSNSPEVVSFDQSYSGTVFLSDLWRVEDTISGVSTYKGLDFNWIPLKLYGSNKETLYENVEFDNSIKHDKLDNSLSTITSPYLFGDSNYTGIYIVSGWINTGNPNWSILEPYVNSGIYISGVTVPDSTWDIGGVNWLNVEDSSGNLHLSVSEDVRYSGQWIGYNSGVGYPFNYYISSKDRIIRFNEYYDSINGWWRPYSSIVTPTGINADYLESGNLSRSYISNNPDFYFNNIPFYKIYKFDSKDNIIDSSVKLYTYQERPINNKLDYYPGNFVWKYKSKWIDQINSKIDVYDSRMLSENVPTNWSGYIINIPENNLRINEEYIVDAINEVKIHGTNSILENTEYQINLTNGQVQSIDLSALQYSRPAFKPSGVSFDYKYKYRVKNEYLSTWVGFIIILAGNTSPYIEISNTPIEGRENLNIIDRIDIEDLDVGVIKTYKDDGGIFKITFSSLGNSQVDSHYKITIYCVSNINTGFCANNWIPYTGSKERNPTITISPLIKIVQKINPIKIVDISDLIYDTPMNNDNRASIIRYESGEKYLIVKIPSKDIFPGYYYNSIQKLYNINYDKTIDNYGHWIRKGIIESGNSSNIFTYTTGSSGSFVYERDRNTIDLYWNNGGTTVDYPNTNSGFFIHHSTLGYPVNVDRNENQTFILRSGMYDPRAPYNSGIVGTSEWYDWLIKTFGISSAESMYYTYIIDNDTLTINDLNRGFLFYSTGENLPNYYSLSYRITSKIDDTNTRFLYKVELNSDDTGNLVPKVKSLRFIINENA